MSKQQEKRPLAIRSLLLVVLCSALFAFSEGTGVDSFTIYLNEKLMLQQYATPEAKVKKLFLANGDANDVLRIHYNHCGKTGTKRSVALHDGEKEVIKTWHFADDSAPVMQVKLKEVLTALRTNAEERDITLVYSSVEIPKGKALVALVATGQKSASVK